jgi:hypothetical protein
VSELGGQDIPELVRNIVSTKFLLEYDELEAECSYIYEVGATKLELEVIVKQHSLSSRT